MYKMVARVEQKISQLMFMGHSLHKLSSTNQNQKFVMTTFCKHPVYVYKKIEVQPDAWFCAWLARAH